MESALVDPVCRAISLVVLYGHETWSLTLKQEYQQNAEDQGRAQKSSLRIADVLAEI